MVALASAHAPPALAQLAADTGGVRVSAGGTGPVITQSGRTTDVTLGATRTVIPWSSFKLGADDAVVFRFADSRGVVLNKVSGGALIDGAIESLAGSTRSAGNVWFSAPGGVVIGPNARVNVGGFLATTGVLNETGFLDAGSLSFDVSGAGTGRIDVQGGRVATAGGALVLVAGSVSTEAASAINGGGAVLVGAANDYTVRFVTAGGDLDLVDFVVPNAAAGTASTNPLTLRGELIGANVFLAVVNRADVASAVINAPGLVAAQTASTDRGDVVLTAGVGVVGRQPGLTRINGVTETTVNLGSAIAQRDLLGGFAAPSVLTGQQLSAGRDLGFAVASLDAGALSAGRLLAVDATRGINLRTGASSAAQVTLRTGGTLVVGGGTGSITSIGRMQIDAGSVRAGMLSSGGSIVVNASGAGDAVSLTSIVADDDVTITTTNATGRLSLGSASFTALRPDASPAGRNLTLTTRGAEADLAFGAGAGLTANGATRVTLNAGRDLSVTLTGLAAGAPVALTAGRDISATLGAAGPVTFTAEHNATLLTSGLLTVAGGTSKGAVLLRAADLDVKGQLSAGSLRIESLLGNITLGGGTANGGALSAPAEFAAAPGDGLRLTDAEFGLIRVTDGVSLYAGAAGSTARGDITVLDLRLDPARTPSLLLGAGPSSTISVTGALAPGASGGIVTLGEENPAGGFQPARILISGSIGAAPGSTATSFIDVHALSETHLNAGSEIILGSPRFIGLVSGLPADQIDIANDLPAGVAPTPEETGHVFIATRVLTMSGARVVMQNTGARTTPGGIFIDGETPTGGGGGPPPSVTITTTGTVDLFGTYRDPTGVVHGGLGAGLSPGLDIGTGGEPSSTPVLRFNGIGVVTGGGGGRSDVITSTFDARLQAVANGNATDASEAAVAAKTEAPPVLQPAEAQDDGETVLDPAPAATGSFELWKRKMKSRR